MEEHCDDCDDCDWVKVANQYQPMEWLAKRIAYCWEGEGDGFVLLVAGFWTCVVYVLSLACYLVIRLLLLLSFPAWYGPYYLGERLAAWQYPELETGDGEDKEP